MNRSALTAAAVLAAALVGAGVWLLASRGSDPAPAAPPSPDASPPARPVPLEPIAGDAAVDAARPVADATLTAEHLKTSGVLGRPLEVSLDYLETMPWWKRVPGTDAPTFENQRKVRFSLVVVGDRVVGADATFPKNALSADVPVMSPALIGQTEALPGGPLLERMDESDPAERSGTFTTSDGRTFYWRATFRTGGEGPWGPVTFQLRGSPFGAAE